MESFLCVSDDVRFGQNVKLAKFINLYGCSIGDNTKIGAFVEIQKNATVGKNCKVSSHSFICEGVTIEDDVFIGSDTQLVAPVTVRRGATIGAGSTITREVAAEALALTRVKQSTIPGWKRPTKKERRQA